MIKWLTYSIKLLAAVAIASVVLPNLYVVISAQSQTKTIAQLENSEFAADDVPILVLGAGIIDNKEPSKVLAKRLDKAVELAQQFPKKALIMSGDHTDDYYNEVAVMKDYLIRHGVASERIYLDHAGYSTSESLARYRYMTDNQRVIVVTQGYHLSRALLYARKIGLQAVGVPADEVKSTRFKREVREIGARMKEVAVLYFGYPPKRVHYDSPYDLQQSGNLTDHLKVQKSVNNKS